MASRGGRPWSLERTAHWASSLRWKLARSVARNLTVHTGHGLLTLDSRDRCIAKSLHRHGQYELDWMLQTTAHLRELGLLPAKGRGVFVDVGANLGVTCVGMLYQGEFERAVALEPDPLNFALLERNAIQNGFGERIVRLQLAASDRRGRLEFELSEDNFGDHRVRVASAADGLAERNEESRRRVIEVEARTLDEIVAALPQALQRDLAMIWMDVQGFEGRVLAGGARTFARGLPLVTEIWPYGMRRAGIGVEELCARLHENWKWFSTRAGAGARLERRPTSDLPAACAELGADGEYLNVLLTS